VNLLQELGVGVDLVRHDHWLGEINEFHKRFLFEVDCSKSARNEESSSRGALNSGLTSADSGLQLDLEIALSGASAKVKPPQPAFEPGRRCVETSGNVIEDDFASTPDSRIWDFSPIRLGTAKTARESAKSPDSRDSKLAPDDQNRFPGLTGRSSRLPETRAREQETVNLSDNTRSAHLPALVNYIIQT
jgi:hypothetical protein